MLRNLGAYGYSLIPHTLYIAVLLCTLAGRERLYQYLGDWSLGGSASVRAACLGYG